MSPAPPPRRATIAAPAPPDAAALRAFSRSLPMALLRAREAVMLRFRPSLREHGLSEQQWRVLRALHAQGVQRASDVSALTLISMPSLSRLLKTLEERGLIKRQVHRHDLRAAQLSLTAAGRRVVNTMAPLSEAIYAEIAAQVGGSSLEQLYALLHTMTLQLGAPTADEGVEP